MSLLNLLSRHNSAAKLKPDQVLIQIGVRGDCDTEALIARLGIQNPFCTVQYARAMQALGHEVWIVGLRSTSEVEGTLGCITKGKLSVGLEFPSLPPIAGDVRFWEVVDRLCDVAGVTDIAASSFGSMPFELPPLRGELTRHKRQEFLLDLTHADFKSRFSSNHKRNLKKAENAGLSVRRTREELDWISDHIALMTNSAQRRTARGELVALDVNVRTYRALMEYGAGQLCQAMLGSTVISSVLVLMSARTGYYHSAGTTAEGMSIGASHFLIHGIASVLKDEGRVCFNLGGAPEDSSLARFKSGFGSSPLVLPTATCYVGPVWNRKIRTAIRLLRNNPKAAIRDALVGRSSQPPLVRSDERDSDLGSPDRASSGRES